jgi:hypothetical protein
VWEVEKKEMKDPLVLAKAIRSAVAAKQYGQVP